MTEDIGHRHSLSVSGLKPAEGRALKVAIRVPPGDQNRVSTQLLVSCIVNLLSRQVGTVREILLLCDAGVRQVPLPMPDAGSDLREALAQLGAWTTDGRIPVRVVDALAMEASEVEIHVGRSAGSSYGGAVALVAQGAGWRAWIGRHDLASVTPAVDDSNPLGPFLAACLAAGEVFKLSRGIVRGRMLDSFAVSLWTGEAAKTWDDVSDGPAIAGARLPPMHVVGAGAVGQALAYILRYCALLEACLAVLDDDRHDRSNLNRCFLAGHGDLTEPKVDVVKRFEGGGLAVYAFEGDLATYLGAQHVGLDHRLVAEVDALDFGVVVSCVDRGGSRQQVQGLKPRIIFGGSTLNLVARTDVYRGRRGDACLGCHNPSERDGERVRQLRKELKEMSREALRTCLIERGIDPRAVEEELARPTCGSDGERALNDMARPIPQFSAGFVSLGAGLLLAANLVREFGFGDSAPPPQGTLMLNFLKGALEHAILSADENCEQQCWL